MSQGLQTFQLIGSMSTPWNAAMWETQDDSSHNGLSHSSLAIAGDHHSAVFSGRVTVGPVGAAYASQQTVGDLRWDLSMSDGMYIMLDPARTDERIYTLNVKNTLPADPMASSLVYEGNFTLAGNSGRHAAPVEAQLPWKAFVATNRGIRDDSAPPVNRSSVKRISIMMRSFFGAQQGNFSMAMVSIGAYGHLDPA